MGCGTLCASGILHEKTPAPRGRELYAGSTRGAKRVQAQPAAPYGGGGFLWEAVRPIMSKRSYGK